MSRRPASIPLAQFLASGEQEGRSRSAQRRSVAPNGSTTSYYLQHNPDVRGRTRRSGSPLRTVGWREGRNPNAYCDTSGYLAHYADGRPPASIRSTSTISRAGRKAADPSTLFDTKPISLRTPTSRPRNIRSLAQFLQHGLAEGRTRNGDGLWS